MASKSQPRGQKRSKAFYRKSTYGAKKHCQGTNILEPGIRGFLVTCNHEERSAVRESYNILNEYADDLYGPDKNAGLRVGQATEDDDVEEECDDMEVALKKAVDELKRASASPMKRFQNVSTKAKNCVFIRTSLENPMEVTSRIMEDIAEKHLKKARYAARILPILGTCKANTKDIEKLASEILSPIFLKQGGKSYTVLFRMRNNNGTSCGRESVLSVVTKVVKEINPDVKLSWTDYSIAIVVEVVCTVCCLGVAPDYFRLRKYNLQELQQGPKENTPSATDESNEVKVATVTEDHCAVESSESIVDTESDSKINAPEHEGTDNSIDVKETESGAGSDLVKCKDDEQRSDNENQTESEVGSPN